MFPITVTKEAMTTFFTGALGAMTFGGFAQFQNNAIMKLNNQLNEQQHQADMREMKEQHKQEMKELKDQMDERERKLMQLIEASQRRRWF